MAWLCRRGTGPHSRKTLLRCWSPADAARQRVERQHLTPDGGGKAWCSTALGWLKAAEYVVVSGKPAKADLESCWELGATVAAHLME